MPNIDPVVRFWIGIAVTVAIAISGGTLSLAHVIPVEYIPTATAWCSLLAFVGSAILTALNGFASTNSSRLASVAQVPLDQKLDAIATIPEVKSIVTTQALAEATTSDKVVGPPKATGTKT